MSAVKALASAVQQCFAIYSLPADLHRKDVAFIGEIGSQLQPVLLSLQKAALQCPEEVAADTALAAATSEQLSLLVLPLHTSHYLCLLYGCLHHGFVYTMEFAQVDDT